MPRLLSWHALRKGVLIIPGEGRFVKGAISMELPVLSVGVMWPIGLL